MNASEQALSLIRRFEGFVSVAYKPVASEKWYTYGYGHCGPDVKEGDVITQAQAENLLRSDVKIFDRELAVVLDGIEVNQNQWDSLISFCFNLGTPALQKSTLLKKLKAGDIQGAADEFLKWNKSGGKVLPGLTKRRQAERQLFLS